MAWTGSVTGGVAGTTSAAFKEDVRRRINFYRALCGLPGDITLRRDQVRERPGGGIDVRAEWPAQPYATEQLDFITPQMPPKPRRNSNIALGNYGPGAVDAYMRDDGDTTKSWATAAGSTIRGRSPWALAMSRRQSPYSSSNALWVIGDFKASDPEIRRLAEPRLRALQPGAGPLVAVLSGGEFLRGHGDHDARCDQYSDTIISICTDTNMGDNTLVWTPSGIPASDRRRHAIQRDRFRHQRHRRPTSYSYTVTLFDPSVLNVSPTIAGNDDSADDRSDLHFQPHRPGGRL